MRNVKSETEIIIFSICLRTILLVNALITHCLFHFEKKLYEKSNFKILLLALTNHTINLMWNLNIFTVIIIFNFYHLFHLFCAILLFFCFYYYL